MVGELAQGLVEEVVDRQRRGDGERDAEGQQQQADGSGMSQTAVSVP